MVPRAVLLVGFAVAACTTFGAETPAGPPPPPLPVEAPNPVDPGAGTAAPTCSDRVHNGNETDVDCGGGACARCNLASRCNGPDDCAKGICALGFCVDPTCTDGLLTGDETGLDCGGEACAPCSIGQACAAARDCRTGYCVNATCSAAPNCRVLRAAAPALPDGVYLISPAGGLSTAFEAFCDMTTDGGGWTFFAHVNNNYLAGTLFESDLGVYRADRIDDNTTYGRAATILRSLDHTQMMVTIDDPVPASAALKNKILFYEFAPHHAAFTTGPIPCNGLETPYGYRIDLAGPFSPLGFTNRCDATCWFSHVPDSGYLTNFTSSPLYGGNYWGGLMGKGSVGTNSWRHDGYWYVR